MKILMDAAEVDERRDEWLKLRRGGITASEIASIMRVDGCYSSPLAVYWHKVAGDEIPETDEMALGRYLEPYIAQRFARQHTGLHVARVGLVCHDRRRWQMATPDLVGWRGTAHLPDLKPDVVGQLKTSATWFGYGDEPDGEIPPAYLAQVLWECDVTGAGGGWLTVMNRATGKIRHYWIAIDAAARHDLDLMRAEAEAFRARVSRLEPPEPDWRPATTAALKRVWAQTVPEAVITSAALRRRLLSARRAQAAAKKRYQAAENTLRAKMRTATVAMDPGGNIWATRAVYPHRYVSVALLRERYPQVADECTITSEQPVDRLYISERGAGNAATQ